MLPLPGSWIWAKQFTTATVNKIGRTRGIPEDAVVVTTRDGFVAMSDEHECAGHEFRMADQIWHWRTGNAVGEIDELPMVCPDCAASKEYLSSAIQD